MSSKHKEENIISIPTKTGKTMMLLKDYVLEQIKLIGDAIFQNFS